MSAGVPPLSGPPKPQAKGLNCPKCGAAIVLRSFGQAVTVVCASCHCVLDAKDHNLAILQQFEAATRDVKPLIPLGTRGKLRGTDYEVIGFQRRSTNVDGITYYWHEYVLFNPYKGIRYLSEYNGHWNDISVCKQLPMAGGSSTNYLGEIYKHFQTSDANTDFVLGEFPWQVRVGEHAVVTDYVHPPRVLSSEKLDKEVTWSIGEYMYGREVWDSFKLPGDPPEAMGVYENQPSPVTINVTGIWVAFAAFTLFLLAIMAGFERRDLFRHRCFRTFRPPFNRGSEDLRSCQQPLDLFELCAHQSGHRTSLGLRPRSELLLRLRQRWFLDRGQAE